MNKAEKRGKKNLEHVIKEKTYKRPVTWYVHYISQAGERLAFTVVGNAQTGAKLEGNMKAHVSPYVVSPRLASDTRLVVLPSQRELKQC